MTKTTTEALTLHTITDAQIQALYEESLDNADMILSLVCEIALNKRPSVNLHDYVACRGDREWLQVLSQDNARRHCAGVLNGTITRS